MYGDVMSSFALETGKAPANVKVRKIMEKMEDYTNGKIQNFDDKKEKLISFMEQFPVNKYIYTYYGG